MIERTWTRPAAVALLLLGLAACEQGRGEPCQVNRDCEEGLECIRGVGVEHATCEPIGSGDQDDDDDADGPDGGADASAMVDASAMQDAAATDAEPEPDAGDEDAATPDGGPDADTVADAAPDAAGDDDAGS